MKWIKNTRASGVVEIVCEHGIGHPALHLTPEHLSHCLSHGCDECCKHVEFKMAEALMLSKGEEIVDLRQGPPMILKEEYDATTA